MLSVSSSSEGSFEHPTHLNPGIYNVQFINNLNKTPLKKIKVQGIEYLKLPEINMLIPGFVSANTL